MMEKGAFREEVRPQDMCCQFAVESDLQFLNHKIDAKWIDPCCGQHECYLTDYLLRAILSELNNPGQLHPCRLLDLVLGLKRLCTIIRDEKIMYPESLLHQMKDFICRYVSDQISIICYATLEIWSCFVQSIKDEGSSVAEHHVLNQICRSFFDNINKYTVRGLRAYMDLTNVELIGPKDWEKYYICIGNHEMITGITDLIVSHACRLVANGQNIDVHLDLIRKALFEGSENVKKAVQVKLIPRMFKSSYLKPVFNEARHSLLDIEDKFYASADPVRVMEVVLLMTKFFVFEPTCPVTCWHDCISVRLIAEALLSSETSVKILAWHLVCQNPRLTRPFSFDELLLSKLFISANMIEQYPATRQRIATEFKAMMVRMRESYKLLTKKAKPENEELFLVLAVSELFPHKNPDFQSSNMTAADVVLENQKTFLKELHEFLFDGLDCSSNFNRKLMAMYLIEALHDSDTFYRNGAVDVTYKGLGMHNWLDDTCFLALNKLLDDGYEINQNLAEKLIPKLSFSERLRPVAMSSELDFSVNFYKTKRYWTELADELILKKLEEIENLIGGECRKIEADIRYLGGEIKLVQLIIYLNGFIQSQVFTKAANDDLISVKIVPLLLRVGKIVSPVVHTLAPEGFWPDDPVGIPDSDESVERTKKAQQLLFNCWRTHREVSAALESLLNHVLTDALAKTLIVENLKYLPPQTLKEVSDYLWVQLTECRHCGAFEAAATSFKSLCIVLWNLNDVATLPHDYSSGIDGPEIMLDKVVGALTEESNTIEICETRRSAGLPPLICAILSTEPRKYRHASLNSCLGRLFGSTVQDPTMIIHIINCLVSVFENSDLSEIVKHYWTPAFLLCFKEPKDAETDQNVISFSDHWPIRNTISRFFAAVVRRMFGKTGKPQKSLFINSHCTKPSNEVFVQLPNLYSVMLQKLEKYAVCKPNSRDEFHIYPLLTMLTHLTPSHTREYSLDVFQKSVLRILLFARGYKMRELAAVALITISTRREFLEMIQKMIDGGVLQVASGMNSCLDGCLELMVMTIEKYPENEIPIDVFEKLRMFYKELVTGLQLEGKCDIVLYHVFVSAVVFADEKDKLVLVDKALTLMEKSKLCDGSLFLTGFARLLTNDGHIWNKVVGRMDDRLRFECYNLSGSGIPSEVKKLLLIDFETVFEDQDLDKVLVPFLENPEYLQPQLLEVFDALLERITRQDLREKLIKCLVYILDTMELDEDHANVVSTFFETSIKSFEAKTRQAALQLILRLARNHRDSPLFEGLLKRTMLCLQDESPEIRYEAGKALDHFIINHTSKLKLNPTILWGIAVDKNPELLEELFSRGSATKNKIGKSRVFSLTELNPFAEDRILPDVPLLKEVIRRLIN